MNNPSPSQAPESPAQTAFPTSTIPGLARVRAMARGVFSKQWPTRVLTVCPPAYGALAPVEMLGAETLFKQSDRVALVLFAPDTFYTQLQVLATRSPVVHVHELVGMRKKEVYLSVSAPSANGKLPKALWVRVDDILAKHLSRSLEGRCLRLPLLVVSGSEACVGNWSFREEDLQRIRAATQSCLSYRYQGPEADRERSLDVAERYGERPWLFLPYDIKVLGRKHAVNWAPVCTFEDGKAVEYLLD